MEPPPAEPKRMGRPAKISREEILATAKAILDESGVEGLTMRKLAAELHATPMALYYHVANKDEVLVALLDDYARGVEPPDLPEDPAERLVALAVLMHDVLAACPWIVQVLAADDLMAVSALWIVEGMMQSCADLGLDQEYAVHVYRTVWYYTVGEIIVRASASERRRHGRPTFRDEVFQNLDAGELPRLAELGGTWARLAARDTFPDGVRALIDGLIRHAPPGLRLDERAPGPAGGPHESIKVRWTHHS